MHACSVSGAQRLACCMYSKNPNERTGRCPQGFQSPPPVPPCFFGARPLTPHVLLNSRPPFPPEHCLSHHGTLWDIPPFRKARKRQCLMARQRGPRKVSVEKSHHGTLWDIAKHNVSAAQIRCCGKGSPWNPLGHPSCSESTQTPVSDGPATGAQKGFCRKEPPWNPLGHRKRQCFRGPDKFLWKRVTMEPFGTSTVSGKHANASV